MSQPKHQESYVVRKGENLWTIADFLYNHPVRWTEVAAMNNIPDPTKLRTGTHLSVPSNGLVAHPRPYKIQKNDTYFTVASQYLGNFSRWPEIARLNSVGPTELRTGMEVRVPLDFRHP